MKYVLFPVFVAAMAGAFHRPKFFQAIMHCYQIQDSIKPGGHRIVNDSVNMPVIIDSPSIWLGESHYPVDSGFMVGDTDGVFFSHIGSCHYRFYLDTDKQRPGIWELGMGPGDSTAQFPFHYWIMKPVD